MLVNPPPSRCEGCGRVTRHPEPNILAAGDPAAWRLLEGPDTVVDLEDGRRVVRRGRGWVCPRCGHLVPLSRELAR